jgi:hypothetical protein
VDALVKLGTIGVPREILWELYGATPQEIIRWRQVAEAQAAQEAAAAASALGAADIASLLSAAGAPPPGGAPAG